MQRIKLFSLTLLLLCLAAGSNLSADTVTLDNGDRITGTVVQMSDGVLIFTSAYGGELQIPWSSVVTLTTEQPIEWLLADESQISGQASTADGQQLAIVDAASAEPRQVVELSEVAEINPGPATTYSTIFNIGITATTGNADTQQYHFDGEFNARNEKNRYVLGIDFNRGEDDGETIVDNWTVYAGYDYFFTERLFWNNTVTLQQNDLQQLDLRTAISSGIGYQFYDTETLKLSSTVGLGYLSENFTLQPSQETIAGRWSLNYEHQWLEWLSFFHNHEGLVSLEDANDFVIRSRTGLRYPIGKYLSGTAQINFNYDNNPSPGTQAEDFTYILSVGYLWE